MILKSTKAFDIWGCGMYPEGLGIATKTVFYPSLFLPFTITNTIHYDLFEGIEHCTFNKISFSLTRKGAFVESELGCNEQGYWTGRMFDTLHTLLDLSKEEFEEWQREDRYAGTDCGQLGFVHLIHIGNPITEYW